MVNGSVVQVSFNFNTMSYDLKVECLRSRSFPLACAQFVSACVKVVRAHDLFIVHLAHRNPGG
jgi:hypothetical protein